jgi:pyruvate carboxylase
VGLLGAFWLTDHASSIESMKMETVIRSPQSGVVKKLAHKEGVGFLFP